MGYFLPIKKTISNLNVLPKTKQNNKLYFKETLKNQSNTYGCSSSRMNNYINAYLISFKTVYNQITCTSPFALVGVATG